MMNRKPTVAGAFYPGTETSLRGMVQELLDGAGSTPEPDRVVGLLAPHAGYVFSGHVAAEAYNMLRGSKPRTVILVGPSHRMHVPGSAVLTEGSYDTPLGSVPVDTDLAQQLAAGGGVREDASAHQSAAAEHSLEVQLPFLQEVLGERMKLVPVVMGSQQPAAVRDLGLALANAVKGTDAVLVASSDLSHFHDDSAARGIDRNIVDAVEAFDPDALLHTLETGRGEACGGGPLGAVMIAARELGAAEARNLKYATSADVPEGGSDRVVGYLSAAFLRG